MSTPDNFKLSNNRSNYNTITKEVRNEICDDILPLLNDVDYTVIPEKVLRKKYSINDEELNPRVYQFLVREDLVEQSPSMDNYLLLKEKGRNVCDIGGITAYLDMLEKIRLKEEQKDLMVQKKQSLEIRNLEWFNKTKWIPLMISICSLLIAILALFKDFIFSN